VQDVDGLHPVNMGRLALSMPGPVPCTPAGIEALLAHYEIPVAGREVAERAFESLLLGVALRRKELERERLAARQQI
jgi:hypothetical protein